MNKEALRQAVRVLKCVADDKFDMGTWFSSDFSVHLKLEQEGTDISTLIHECGTSACVIGHCGFDAWFIERGFTMGIKSEYRVLVPKFIAQNGEPQENWDAIKCMFGIGFDQAAYLFSDTMYNYPDYKVPRSAVISRISKFIETAEME